MAFLTSIFYLVFSTPEMDTIVGTYDTKADCDEVVWVMERFLAGASVYCTNKP